MKQILLLAVALCSVALCKAADDWKLYFSNESIAIYYTYADCHDDTNGIHRQKILYRLVNKTDSKVEVSFTKLLHYTNSAPTEGDGKSHIVLDKAQQVEGDCASRNSALHTFVKHLDMKGRELIKCELKNITVKPIE